jgi:hypothetical protein
MADGCAHLRTIEFDVSAVTFVNLEHQAGAPEMSVFMSCSKHIGIEWSLQ